MRWFRWDFWNLVIAGCFVLLGIFVLFPLLSTLMSSFFDETSGKFSLHYFNVFFTKKYYYGALLNSLKVGVVVTFFAVLIGVPIAYITTRFRIPGKKLIHMLIIMSLMSPPFIGAYSWILLMGRSGIITRFLGELGLQNISVYGFVGIVVVFVLKLFPFIYLYAAGALKMIDSSLEEAAENLGVSGLRKLLTVTFPLIIPSIVSGALMVFMSTIADFGTPMLIGEGFTVIPVLIYSEFIGETGGSAAFACAISLVVVLLTIAIFLVQKYIVSKKSYVMSALRPPKQQTLRGANKMVALLFVYTITFFAVLPQLTVVCTSFLKTRGPVFVPEFSLGSYESILSKLTGAIVNTFSYGLIALVIMVVLGILIAYLSVRRKNIITNLLDSLVMFPYIIPGSVLGITLLLSFNKEPLLLSGSAIILIIAYVIRRLPYTVRSGSAILYQIDKSIDEASINLGVSPLKTFFKVTSRLMLPGVVSGAILSWITTINELSASVLLYTGKTMTISVAVYTEVIRASYGTAAALATILTATTVLSLIIFYIIAGNEDINV